MKEYGASASLYTAREWDFFGVSQQSR